MISTILHMLIISIIMNSSGNIGPGKEPIHFRINLVGYLPNEHKSGIVFSHRPVKENFSLIEEGSGAVVLTIEPVKSMAKGWGTFEYYYELDFNIGVRDDATVFWLPSQMWNLCLPEGTNITISEEHC